MGNNLYWAKKLASPSIGNTLWSV